LRSTNAASAAIDFGGAPGLDRSQKKRTAPPMRSNKHDELTTNNIANAVLDRQQERYLIDCGLLETASLARASG
jgi:hypothetical protein